MTLWANQLLSCSSVYPSDFLDFGLSLIRIFSLSSSSSTMVSAAAGGGGGGGGFAPSVRLLPAFRSVRGGLGGPFPIGTVFRGDSLVFEALTSVAGGDNISIPVRGTTASLLCCFEKEGYGRLVFESDDGVGSTSVSRMPGIELLLVSSLGRDVLESAWSLLELLRCDDLRCSLLSAFSSLRDESFLRLTPSLGTRIPQLRRHDCCACMPAT